MLGNKPPNLSEEAKRWHVLEVIRPVKEEELEKMLQKNTDRNIRMKRNNLHEFSEISIQISVSQG